MFLEKESHPQLRPESLSQTFLVGVVSPRAIVIVLISPQEQSSFYDGPGFTATGPQSPPTPSSSGLNLSEFAHHEKQKHAPKLNEKIAEDVRSQPEQTEGAPDNRSTIWDIELEDGTLLSDSSSFDWGTTVVIDTERIWDSCDQPQSLATRSSGEYSRSSPRVTSRFFSKCVFGLREGGSAPGTPSPDWGGHSGEEFEVPDWDDYHCTDVRWGRSSSQEADSPSGSCCRTHLSHTGTCIYSFNGGGLTVADKVHQEVMPEWNMRSFGTPVVELANPEDNDFPVSDSSLEAGYEMFSDLDSPGRVHCFLEGRRLLFGV